MNVTYELHRRCLQTIMEKEKEIAERFNVDSLREHQIKGIKAVCAGTDVFVGTKTGSGKSMIYECMPVIFPSAVVVIVAPLVSIMKEQTDKLCSLGFKATYVGKDVAQEEDIINGKFNFVFGSPEALVGEKKWRNMLTNYGKKMKLLVVDEAHTVVQWGSSDGEKPGAFREWFSHIGELRAIRPDVPIAALTATSSPSQRRKIMKSLCFRQTSVIVSETPDRRNIKMSSMCIPNNSDVEDTFNWLLEGLENQKENFPRHVIFSESISDVAKIYAIFRKRCGKCELYEMFHSKTVEDRKDYIRTDMAKDGSIRVLICTNSAGMGVNFFGVHNIVHYGLPREMDTLVQQMGRAGRDGVFSHELIIYKCHKGNLKQAEEELVQLAKDTKCRREVLCTSYGSKVERPDPLHLCCDICEKLCKCESVGCPNSHPALKFQLPSSSMNYMSREVEESDKILLRQKLDSLRFKLSDFSTVVTPDLTHGLTDDVIDYIVNHVELLFTTDDVLRNCAIWSYDVAVEITKIINDTFGDDIMYDAVDSDVDDE